MLLCFTQRPSTQSVQNIMIEDLLEPSDLCLRSSLVFGYPCPSHVIWKTQTLTCKGFYNWLL